MLPSEYVLTKKIATDKSIKYQYFMDKTHPLADKIGKVYYHRHVASVKLGRWVTKDDQIHHLDCNRGNNAPDNLVVMTSTDHHKTHHPKVLPLTSWCSYCGGEFTPTHSDSLFCSHKCAHLSRRTLNIEKSELEQLVWSRSTKQVGLLLGVSDSAIGKRCKLLGIKKPGRGYWNKVYAGVSAPISNR